MSRVLPLAAAAASSIQVGAAMVATRFIGAELGPASLALIRYAISVCCLLPLLMMIRGSGRVAWRDVPALVAIGIGQFGMVVALLNVGLRTKSASRAALIFATFPLMTLLFAAAIGHERLGWRKAAGVVSTIGGVGVALGAGVGGTPGGALAVAASALCGAVSTVLCRPYLRRYDPLLVSIVAMLGAILFLAVPAGFNEGLFRTWPDLSRGAELAVAFIGVGSAMAYYLWLWALSRVPATDVAVFLALGPVTALVFGAALLGEPVTANAIVGTGCVAAGLWLATRRPPRAAVSLR